MTTAPAPILRTPPAAAPAAGSLHARALAAVQAAVDALMAKQRTDRGGPHWCAELEGDSILSSEYLLMKFILGQERAPGEWPRLCRIANQLRLSQRADGTWGQYPGSPADQSACVKAYFTLKLMGDSPEAPHMARAREAILKGGGAELCNTFSTFYLACLGQVTWDACPAIPPQVVLLPRWFPFHLDKVAAWTRTMILPLALCSALQPVRQVAPELGIDELFIDKSAKSRLSKTRDQDNPLTWNNFFLTVDSLLKFCRRIGFTPLRKSSVKLAAEWVAQRMDPATTEGLGAIFPPMVYAQVAFQALGYTRDHPLIKQAETDLDAFMIDEPNPDPRLDHIRLQPCFSPVWDTSIALEALTEAGLTAANDDRVARACDWLLEREVKRSGDWINNLRRQDRALRPGIDMACWAFEYKNDWYPDIDDTCMVSRALWQAGDRPGETRNRDAAKRAVRWLFAMQNDDGGWAAFDRTRHRAWMEAIPFADHNAMQDPTCSDVTGRVMEALVSSGVSPTDQRFQKAIAYLVRTQEPEGCWWGRWGVNYIYGTWKAVDGLVAAAVPTSHPALIKSRDWLLSIQNDDGGFGESANSYLDRALMGRGPSTASQTAWAMLALMNLLPIDHPSITRAAQWLCDQQLVSNKKPFTAATHRAPSQAPAPDAALVPLDHVYDLAGGWNEHWFTGTGFPKVFYLRYHLYRHSFPLKALAKFAAKTAQ